MSRHNVVVIGSGFAGLFATKKLKKADVDVTLISKTRHHLFQPLLYQVATGILSPGEIAPSTREILKRQKNANVLLGLVEDIDPDAKVVKWRQHGLVRETPYDSLIVGAGATQSYFGNDQYAQFAPGLKTVDDALEIRSRILDSFEKAEIETDPKRREEFLTFVVVGAGPTGVELAGQIREMANNTLKDDYENFDPSSARVVLVDGANQVLPPFGEKLGAKAQSDLENLDIEVHTNSLVTSVDARTITWKDKDGNETSVNAHTKIWSAGVQGAPIGKIIAERTGAELDRGGRIVVNQDLTIPNYPDIYIAGDLMKVDGVPGVAQGAIQAGEFAAEQIRLKAENPDAPLEPAKFEYNDRGSMAIISKYKAIAKIGKLEFSGFPAFAAWLVIHIVMLTGFKGQFATLIRWAVSFLSNSRSDMTVTNQQLIGRLAVEKLGAGASEKLLYEDK